MASDNLMENRPKRNPNITWEENENIVLVIERTSKVDRLVQKFFNTPKFNKVNLDEFGSFVWGKCDGYNTVYDIAQEIDNHFGEKANPVLERLVQYIKILISNKFVTLE